MKTRVVYILEYEDMLDTDYVFAGVYSTYEKADKEAAKLRRMMHVHQVSITPTTIDKEIEIDEF